MRQKKNLQKISSMGLIFMLLGIIIAASCTATPLDQTTLEITAVKGGFGKVSVTVKNIGNETAENITMIISVKGGILGRVNLTKICSGCGNCTNSILPNATKTESTAEAGRIIGFGPVVISASAEASNAAKVEKTYNGFVLGLLVIVTQ
ncbi:MAG: hypothetical protein NTX92_03450 [Euryarchaeota archaeon]|jgi:hypothetical protein|nr:hypothetical protein [Euryarchaeota archaeon]